jgi:hypothetical protein
LTFFERAQQTKQYIAMGGYCDYLKKYREVLDLAEEMGSRFDGLYLQVFSCDQQKYQSANLRAEALGVEVSSFSLEGCEPSLTK